MIKKTCTRVSSVFVSFCRTLKTRESLLADFCITPGQSIANSFLEVRIQSENVRPSFPCLIMVYSDNHQLVGNEMNDPFWLVTRLKSMAILINSTVCYPRRLHYFIPICCINCHRSEFQTQNKPNPNPSSTATSQQIWQVHFDLCWDSHSASSSIKQQATSHMSKNSKIWSRTQTFWELTFCSTDVLSHWHFGIWHFGSWHTGSGHSGVWRTRPNSDS